MLPSRKGFYNNYIHTYNLNLSTDVLTRSCGIMNNIVKDNFNTSDGGDVFIATNTLSTQLFAKYNLLLYPLDGFHELYNSLKHVFREVAKPVEPYYIGCWLNYYKQGEYIDWHHHWHPSERSWHGYYCVNTEAAPSVTSYCLSNGEQIDIPSQDDLFVISKSDGDSHRTWPWEPCNEPRITIAFDIVPADILRHQLHWLNHWIPI